MVKNREIRVRVTRDQLERIQMNAQAKGFKTVSGYLRSLCLEHNKMIEDKIIENNRMLREMIGKIGGLNGNGGKGIDVADKSVQYKGIEA